MRREKSYIFGEKGKGVTGFLSEVWNFTAILGFWRSLIVLFGFAGLAGVAFSIMAGAIGIWIAIGATVVSLAMILAPVFAPLGWMSRVK